MIRKKLFSYYVVLVVTGMIITGFFVSQLANNLYKRNVENKLVSIAKLIINEISEESKGGRRVDYNSLADKYAKALADFSQDGMATDMADLRITIIDHGGNVLGDSEADYKTMENHLMRNEVQEAIKGSIGMDIRHSKTLDTDFLYIAVKSSEIIIRLSLPLIEINNINWIIWRYIAIGILAGLLITILLALRFSASVTRPVNELIVASKEISKGNYSKRVQLKTNDEFNQLADTFNEMASRLEHTVADLTDKNMKVETIINSMMDGIIAVDNNYRIVLINRTAREMFDIDNNIDVIGSSLIEVVRNNRLNSYVRKSVSRGVSSINEILIGSTSRNEKTYKIHTNPIKSVDSSEKISGAIVLIQDITNLKKLEQIRTDFVSNVTHELKTPLTSIRGFIETLRTGAINDPEVADSFLEIIDIESERLYTLIDRKSVV